VRKIPDVIGANWKIYIPGMWGNFIDRFG